MSLMLPAKYKDEGASERFYSDVVQRVKAYPGVESAAAVNFIPMGGSNASDATALPRPIISARWACHSLRAATFQTRTKPVHRPSRSSTKHSHANTGLQVT